MTLQWQMIVHYVRCSLSVVPSSLLSETLSHDDGCALSTALCTAVHARKDLFADLVLGGIRVSDLGSRCILVLRRRLAMRTPHLLGIFLRTSPHISSLMKKWSISLDHSLMSVQTRLLLQLWWSSGQLLSAWRS